MEHNSTTELDALFRAHYERITRVIGRIVHEQARAEELAVDVFVKASRNRALTEGWLYQAAVRLALDEWRRQARGRRLEGLMGFFGVAAPSPEDLCASSTEQQQVRAVLAAMTQRHAEILLLWTEDLSYREIATALSLELSYVGSLLSRAQSAFRKEYVKRHGTNY
jgi:RNA polymerase sigma-70 factor, ECF subfamily